MEKKKNKFLDFVLSLILPRRMIRNANMRFVFSLLIVMLVVVLQVLSSNARSTKDAEKALEFPSDYTSLDGISFDTPIPHLSLDEGEVTGYYYKDGERTGVQAKGLHLNSDANGVYTGEKIVGDHRLVVTVVINDECYSTQGTVENPAKIENFDLDGYCLQTKEDKTDYILYVFTLDAVYYLFNFEQIRDGKSTKAALNSFLFESSDSKTLIYYLPNDSSELALNSYGNIDTTKWTKKVNSTDTIDFSLPTEYASYQNQIVPSIRHLSNIGNALYGDGLSYANLKSTDFDIANLYSNFNEFQKQYKAGIISIGASQIKITSLITSGIVCFVFTFLLSFVTWIISKNFVLRKFKQYYALVSICFSLGGLVSLILGFFISYLNTWFYILLFETLYYIVVCFRINTMKPKDEEENNENDKNNKEEKVEKEPLKYQKVDNDISSVG